MGRQTAEMATWLAARQICERNREPGFNGASQDSTDKRTQRTILGMGTNYVPDFRPRHARAGGYPVFRNPL
jgi:hypothetical protein